jgi:hypothetical protein
MTACARCGTALGPDDGFCTQCGATVVAADPAVSAPARSGYPMPAVVVVVVALLAAGGAAWYVRAEPTAVPASTSDASAAPSADSPALAPAARPGTAGTPVPADPAAALAAQIEADRSRAEESVGYWVPQISSKAVGMEVDGVAYDAARILEEFRDANEAHDAFLVRSDDYSTFQRSGYWVALVPQRFTDGRAANSWCVTNGFTPDDCFAKRLSHTEAPDGTTLHWSP